MATRRNKPRSKSRTAMRQQSAEPVAEHKGWPDPQRPTGKENDLASEWHGHREAQNSRHDPMNVPDGLQRFDTVGNDFEDCQEGHGRERAGNPPDRMPKEK